MQKDEFERLAHLWTLRALHWKGMVYRFVKNDSFHDRDLAEALDLSFWLEDDEGGDIRKAFSRAGLNKALIARISEIIEEVPMQKPETNSRFSRKAIIRVLSEIFRIAEREAKHSEPKGPPHFERNCGLLQKAYGLSPLELKILRFKILECQVGALRDVMSLCDTKKRSAHIHLVGTILDEPPERIERAVTYDSRLIRLQLVNWSNSRNEASFDATDGNMARRVFSGPCRLEDILEEVVCQAPRASLSYTNFPHLKETLGPLRSYLKDALRTKKAGVNIFFYGEPGTGKSELSRILAREMKAPIYEISSEDGAGMSIRAERRMDALIKAGEVMKKKRVILVFDEAEDVFRASSLFGRSLATERKGWTNRMLENNPVPLIWISNSLIDLDPAFARRFDFVFEVKAPPRQLRRQLYRKICGASLPEKTIQMVTECDELTPAVVQRAKTVTDTVCRNNAKMDYRRVFEDRLKQTLRAQGHDTKVFSEDPSIIPNVYGLDYLNCSKPIHQLPDALKTRSDCRICLFGPPGTGKTTLGHWLAKEMVRPIHVKKASDLLGPYLGQTERALARAFEEAGDEKAILMIDEVDGFLQDRRDAQRSWEIQQVNELLTQMERFRGTFIASTNLMDGIEPAALRRFDLKLHFDFLRPQQLADLLLKHTAELGISQDIEQAQASLRSLSNCTPGDFANAVRQHHFQQFRTATDFVGAITEECRMKRSNLGRKLGFS